MSSAKICGLVADSVEKIPSEAKAVLCQWRNHRLVERGGWKTWCTSPPYRGKGRKLRLGSATPFGSWALACTRRLEERRGGSGAFNSLTHSRSPLLPAGLSGNEGRGSYAQGSERNAILLARLALCCVIVLGFGPSLSVLGPKLDPTLLHKVA